MKDSEIGVCVGFACSLLTVALLFTNCTVWAIGCAIVTVLCFIGAISATIAEEQVRKHEERHHPRGKDG